MLHSCRHVSCKEPVYVEADNGRLWWLCAKYSLTRSPMRREIFLHLLCQFEQDFQSVWAEAYVLL